jgi:hypothetical protein
MDYIDIALAEFDVLIKNQTGQYFESIKDKVRLLLQLAIDKAVYQYYTPYDYNRQGRLKDINNISYKIADDNSYLDVYLDEKKLSGYYSNAGVTLGEDVSKWIPYWIQHGHHNDRVPIEYQADGKPNQYHHYSTSIYKPNDINVGRQYLEMAKELIETELGIQVTIVDTPPDED